MSDLLYRPMQAVTIAMYITFFIGFVYAVVESIRLLLM